MISDVLFDAKYEIEKYLVDPIFAEAYKDEDLKQKLHGLIANMEEIQRTLDTPPGIEELFWSLISKIKERCIRSGIEFDDFGKELDSRRIQPFRLHFSQGRGTREVVIRSAINAQQLLNIAFENYRFLTGYDAVFSFEDDYIEAVISPLHQISTQELYEKLFNLTSLEFFEYNYGSVISDLEIKQENQGNSVKTIVIGPITDSTSVLLNKSSDFLDGSLSIKISGVQISSHDQAIECLLKYSNSIFFQLDLALGLPLNIQRHNITIVGETNNFIHTDFELQFPNCQYDPEPLSLYWYARSAKDMPLLQYLAYYQAIEYYFPLYSQIKIKNDIQAILKTPGFNVHKDSDIVKILNASKSGTWKGAWSERTQLVAVVKECVSGSLLKTFLEENEDRKSFFQKKQKGLNLERIPLDTDDDQLFSSVVNRVYDLRCRVVHAKNENVSMDVESILPFSKSANLLKFDIDLIRFIAVQVLIRSSYEFDE